MRQVCVEQVLRREYLASAMCKIGDNILFTNLTTSASYL